MLQEQEQVTADTYALPSDDEEAMQPLHSGKQPLSNGNKGRLSSSSKKAAVAEPPPDHFYFYPKLDPKGYDVELA
ncbi:hypothetical protein HaLaN_08735, partial [Haematococcus lacustris]